MGEVTRPLDAVLLDEPKERVNRGEVSAPLVAEGVKSRPVDLERIEVASETPGAELLDLRSTPPGGFGIVTTQPLADEAVEA